MMYSIPMSRASGASLHVFCVQDDHQGQAQAKNSIDVTNGFAFFSLTWTPEAQ